jgi:hypothetical protein
MDVTESGQAVVVMAGASVVPGDAPCLVCDGGGAFKGQVCGHCRLQELVDASGEVAEAGSSGERVSASAGGGKQVTFSEVDEVQIFDADAPPREVREDRAELEEEAQWLQSAGERLDELAGKPPRSRPPIAVEELPPQHDTSGEALLLMDATAEVPMVMLLLIIAMVDGRPHIVLPTAVEQLPALTIRERSSVAKHRQMDQPS